MKRFITVFLIVQFLFLMSHELFSQTDDLHKEFGISTGAFTNFPANQNYLKENMSVLYIAPYVRVGKHEFSAGMAYPLNYMGLNSTENTLTSRPGAVAGYKFYVFDIYGRENMFIHYSFQYLRFKGTYDVAYSFDPQSWQFTETDMYINNVIGLGYNIFFDNNERFGFFYTLDYVISQTGFKMEVEGNSTTWSTQFAWNNISTGIGLIFRLSSMDKKVKK